MSDTYEPVNLQRWTKPDNYAGATWPDYYRAGVGRSRDSDALEESNFQVMLRDLGGESDTVIVVTENHWAVGWVEWIAIHETDGVALSIADRNKGRLENYPILSEDHFGELEWNIAADYWDGMSPRERVQWALDARKKYHWLTKEPVWMYGRWDYHTLANSGSPIAESVCNSLRE